MLPYSKDVIQCLRDLVSQSWNLLCSFDVMRFVAMSGLGSARGEHGRSKRDRYPPADFVKLTFDDEPSFAHFPMEEDAPLLACRSTSGAAVRAKHSAFAN